MTALRTIAFYKPYDVLSNFTDPEGRETLQAYIDVPGVYAAGRLDRDSEGLLLLSNDGVLIHRLTDPRFHLAKTYFAQVEGEITPQALAGLRRGVEIQGYRTRPAKVEEIAEPDIPPRPTKPITPHGPVHWLQIEISEGKKRQVRHMTAAVGLPTLRLLRVAIGPIRLGDLQPGQWRDLTSQELDQLTLRSKARRS